MYADPESLDLGDLVHLIKFLSFYNDMVQRLEAGPRCMEFDQASDALFAEYLGRMRLQLTAWLSNIQLLDLTLTPRPDHQGHLVTPCSLDIMKLVRVQIDQNFDMLPLSMLLDSLPPTAVAMRSAILQVC